MNVIKKAVSRAAFALKKYAPEILVVGGTVGLVAAGIIAAVQSTKLDNVLAECENRKKELVGKFNKIDEINEELPEEAKADGKTSYTEADEKSALVGVAIENGWSIVKLYLPACILAVASAAGILSGFGIMRARYVAVGAAFAQTCAAFAEFRQRTKETVTEEQYSFIADGKGSKTLKEAVDENGNKVVVEVDGVVNPVKDAYTFEWNEYTSHVYKRGDFSANEAVLTAAEKYFNNQLRVVNGYVYLNDILDELGIEKTEAGQVCGWVMNPGGGHVGDNYIDFGIVPVDDVNDETMKITRRYILHFNCDGNILKTFTHAYEGDK